jgi:polysaccharide pyruvyl transferase WcaK-like protein
MSAPRILIQGYYGHANFGDDLLMIASYRLLRSLSPEASIAIETHGNVEWVTSLLADVPVRTPADRGHYDLIVHGGGGVFFDFADHSFWVRMREACLMTWGMRTYVRLEARMRQWLGKPRTQARHRIGIGIGMGQFSKGSPRRRHALPILSEMNALWLRDTVSKPLLAPFRSILKATIMEGSDLAFLHEYWLPSDGLSPRTPPIGKPRLGIALRDWSRYCDASQRATLEATLKTLAQEYEITGFILDATKDDFCRTLLAPYTTHVWTPSAALLVPFLNALRAQDVLLTSRAHGAIAAACLGVPSVIIALEDKLTQVHRMLPHASLLVAANAPVSWAAAIANARRILPADIDRDIAENHARNTTARIALRTWIP